jgi:hypothetical protein
MTDLLSLTALTVRFQSGTTANGHHWDLLDDDDEPVGEVRRVHSGGRFKRAMWKSVTLTGMDAGNDIRAAVHDAEGRVVAHLFSHNTRPEYLTEVSDADGTPIGQARRRDNEGFTLEDPDGTVLARLDYTPQQEDPIYLRDAAGEPIAALARVPAKHVSPFSVTAMVLDIPDMSAWESDVERTKHRGFAHASVYSVRMEALPAVEPLRTLTALSPVIGALSY